MLSKHKNIYKNSIFTLKIHKFNTITSFYIMDMIGSLESKKFENFIEEKGKIK